MLENEGLGSLLLLRHHHQEAADEECDAHLLILCGLSCAGIDYLMRPGNLVKNSGNCYSNLTKFEAPFRGCRVGTYSSGPKSSSAVGSSTTGAPLIWLVIFARMSSEMVTASWLACRGLSSAFFWCALCLSQGGMCQGQALRSSLPFCHFVGPQLVYTLFIGGQPRADVHQ